MTGFSIGLGVSAAPQVTQAPGLAIAAILAPAIRSVEDGDRLSDTLAASATEIANYASSEGGIVSVLAEWSVDGAAWTADGTRTVRAGEAIRARIGVADDAGNTRVFPTGITTVPGLGPGVTLNLSLAGRVVTATAVADGTPAPELSLALSADGQPVTPEGEAPEWRHEVPSGADPVTIAATVTATNSAGRAEDSASLSVPADMSAPALTASASLSGRDLEIAVDGLSGSPAPTVVLSALRLDGTDVADDATGTGPWRYAVPDSAAAQTVAWEVRASNALGSDTASGSETIAGIVTTPAPALDVSASLKDQTLTLALDGAETATLAALTLDGSDVLGAASGSVLVPELVNGSGDSIEGWATGRNGGTIAAVDGALVVSATGRYASVAHGFPSVPGEVYTISADLVASDVATWIFIANDPSNYFDGRTDLMTAVEAPHSARLAFTATADMTYIHLVNGGSDGAQAVFDNVSARRDVTYEVPASTADQAVAWEVSAGGETATGSLTVPGEEVTTTPPPSLSAPVNTAAPVVTGGSGLGDVLSATEGSWTGDPVPSLARQWTRDGAPISGATAADYTIALADDGAVLACTVTASNSEGTAEATSNGIAVADFAAPVNTALPAISGTAAIGGTLSVNPGSWSGTPTPSLARQWTRDGAPIPGATAADYDPVSVDAGTVLACEITATNALGSVTVAASGVTIPAPAVAPANVEPPVLSGEAHVGGTLVASEGRWSGTPDPVITRQWVRDGTDIPGATTDTYLPQPGDEGTVIACTVTATNSAGTASATTGAAEIELVAVGTTAGGETEFTYNRDGTVTLSVSNSSIAAFNGDHVFTAAALDSGPVVLVPPAIAGSAATGGTLSLAQASLVAYTGELARSYRWLRDGSAIAGATNAAGYQVLATDMGTAISLAEDLEDANNPGSPVTTESAAAQIPFSSATMPAYTGFGTASTTPGDLSATVEGLAIGTALSDRVVFVALHLEHAGAPSAISAVRIGGVPATLALANGQAAEAVNQFTHTAIFHAVVPEGTTTDVRVDLAAGDTGFRETLSAAVYVGSGTLELHATAAQSTAGTSVALSLDTSPGGVAIAACTHRVNGEITPPTGMVEHYEQNVNYYDAAGASMATTAAETRAVTFTSTASNFFSAAAVSIKEIS